jgi:hypothetical protein
MNLQGVLCSSNSFWVLSSSSMIRDRQNWSQACTMLIGVSSKNCVRCCICLVFLSSIDFLTRKVDPCI